VAGHLPQTISLLDLSRNRITHPKLARLAATMTA